jgi:hypothetical protein
MEIRRTLGKKRLIWLVALAVIVVLPGLLQLQNRSEKKASFSGEGHLENRFFTLDFADSSLDLSDMENHFFTTFPHDDPTHGDVVYDRKEWRNSDVVKFVSGDGIRFYIRDRQDDDRFDSFRATTKAYFNLNETDQRILFVFKGEIPSARGLWPAWWLNGSRQDEWIYVDSVKMLTDNDLDRLSGKGRFYDTPSAVNGTDWPGSGEIDIIETINGDNIIHNTIHTCPQMCDSEWNKDGVIINCANATSSDPNSGCSGQPYHVASPEGTFACLWEESRIRFYYWTPDMDVRVIGGPLSSSPDPDTWVGDVLKNEVRLLGTAELCDSTMHQEWQCDNCESSNACEFINLKMIFNATLCGKWAGGQFDNSENALRHCREYISGEGGNAIDGQFLKIEYVSVKSLKSECLESCISKD